MRTHAVVQALVLVAGSTALVATHEAASHHRVSTSGQTWRALVIDGRTERLLLLDPEAPQPTDIGGVVPGYVFKPRDSSRLVIFGRRERATWATVYSQSPPHVLGPVSLGNLCQVPHDEGLPGEAFILRDMIESPDGRRVTFSCSGMIVALDLHSGAVLRQPVPTGSTLQGLSDGRVIAFRRQAVPPETEALVHEASTLALTVRIRVDADLSEPTLVSGGKDLLFVEHDNRNTKKPGPSNLRYFDAGSGAPTRVISLDAPFRLTRVSSDGRFVYATNVDRNVPKQTARTLRILNAATGEVLETVELLAHASWFDGSRTPNMIVDRRFRQPESSRLLVLDGARVIGRLALHDDVYLALIEVEHGRMYVLDGRTLSEYSWPGLRLARQVPHGRKIEWDTRPATWFAPGGDRALVVFGGSALVADLQSGRAMPTGKLGTPGARARKFWSEFGIGLLAFALSGGQPSSMHSWRVPFASTSVAFSADGRTAMAPAPTGEISMIDMTTGRCVRHLPAGEGAMGLPGGSFMIAVDRKSSWIVNVATAEIVARLPDATADPDARVFASLSPDRRAVLIGRGAALHMVDATTGKIVAQWTGFGRIAGVRTVARGGAQ